MELEQELGKKNEAVKIYRDMFANATIPSIEYEGLPTTCDTLYGEKSLFYNHMIVFFETEDGLVLAKASAGSNPNPYNLPTKIVWHTPNGQTGTIDAEDCVIMYNDVLRRPGFIRANYFAEKAAFLEDVIFQNARCQRNPLFAYSSKEDELSMKQVQLQYEMGQTFINVSTDFNPESIKISNLAIPFTAMDIRKLQKDYISQYLLSVGIADSDNNKAERMLTSEIATNVAEALAYANSRLLPRQQAIEQINIKFGHLLPDGPASVRYRNDIMENLLMAAKSNPNIYGQETYTDGGEEDV